MEKNRNSNIELLRILCMISIILHHSIVHSKILLNSSNINYYIINILQITGPISNNIFILITGYYMINKKVKITNLVKLVLENIFYSYCMLFIYLVIFKGNDINVIIKSTIPVLSNSEWIITGYILLYLSIPIINKLLNSINEREYVYVIFFGIIVFSILPTLHLLNEYFSCYIWFIVLYLVGGYFNIYREKCKQFYEKNTIIFIFSLIATILLILVKVKLNSKFIFFDVKNFMIFILALTTFIIFLKKKEIHSKTINFIASSTLGVYLIHDNIIMRDWIWNKVNIQEHIMNNNFWLYEISVIAVIFFSCILIDKVRKYMLEKPIMSILENKKGVNNVKINFS